MFALVSIPVCYQLQNYDHECGFAFRTECKWGSRDRGLSWIEQYRRQGASFRLDW